MKSEGKRYITRPRLPLTAYAGNHAFHVTVVTRGREPLLTDALAASVIETMLEVASRTDISLLAYCVMPDHVHILAEGESERADVLRFVQRFKQRTSYQHVGNTGQRLWQPSFHDHALRQSEGVNEVARYIFSNPREAGLGEEDAEWPYSGGTMFEAFVGRS
jgi:REP element-mobilizing transposase RayT